MSHQYGSGRLQSASQSSTGSKERSAAYTTIPVSTNVSVSGVTSFPFWSRTRSRFAAHSTVAIVMKRESLATCFPGTPAETIGIVPLVARLRWPRKYPAMGVQEPLGVELGGVVTVEHGIVVALPKIRDAHGPFGDEHAVVPDILGRVVGNASREGRTPTESLFDYGLYIRQVGSIRESRGSGAPDDGVELCLCTLLYFRASDHGKRPPSQGGIGRFCTSSTW